MAIRATRLTIRNILGIEELDINLGSFTKIQGGNGVGKTSAVEALKSMIEGGHDASLLRNGATEGEVVLVLDDNSKIRERVTAKSTTREVQDPKGTKQKSPKAVIDSLFDSFSANPIAFLTADRNERARVLLETIPLTIDPAVLSDITGRNWPESMTTGHALLVLEKVHEALFAERTAKTVAMREAEAAADRLKKSLPPEPDADYAALVEVERAAIAAIDIEEGKFGEHIGGLLAAEKLEQANKLSSANEACHAAMRQHDEEIRRLEALIAEQQQHKARIRQEMQAYKAEHDAAVAEAVSLANAGFAEKKAGWDVQRTKHRAEMARLQDLVKQHARAETIREEIGRAESAAKTAEVAHAELSERLKAIDNHKRSLLDKLPIEGLTVKEGQIHLDGIPFDRLNRARQVSLALKVAILRAGKLGLVLIDNAECLDQETFEAFEEGALEVSREKGVQFIVTRVTSGDRVVTAA